jgi:hypothetical protein
MLSKWCYITRFQKNRPTVINFRYFIYRKVADQLEIIRVIGFGYCVGVQNEHAKTMADGTWDGRSQESKH